MMMEIPETLTWLETDLLSVERKNQTGVSVFFWLSLCPSGVVVLLCTTKHVNAAAELGRRRNEQQEEQ